MASFSQGDTKSISLYLFPSDYHETDWWGQKGGGGWQSQSFPTIKGLARTISVTTMNVGDRVRVKADAPGRLRPGGEVVILSVTIEWRDAQDLRDGKPLPDPNLRLFEVRFDDGEQLNIFEDWLESI